jgi:hypothetical protein
MATLEESREVGNAVGHFDKRPTDLRPLTRESVRFSL